jgi:hypothetical protein
MQSARSRTGGKGFDEQWLIVKAKRVRSGGGLGSVRGRHGSNVRPSHATSRTDDVERWSVREP